MTKRIRRRGGYSHIQTQLATGRARGKCVHTMCLHWKLFFGRVRGMHGIFQIGFIYLSALCVYRVALSTPQPDMNSPRVQKPPCSLRSNKCPKNLYARALVTGRVGMWVMHLIKAFNKRHFIKSNRSWIYCDAHRHNCDTLTHASFASAALQTFWHYKFIAIISINLFCNLQGAGFQCKLKLIYSPLKILLKTENNLFKYSPNRCFHTFIHFLLMFSSTEKTILLIKTTNI